MDRLSMSAEIVGCRGLVLTTFLWTNQSEPFVGNFNMLFKLCFLLGRVFALVTMMPKSLVFSLNVDIELELSLSGVITVRTLECHVVAVDGLYVTVETALTPQFQSAGLASKPPTLVYSSGVDLECGLCLTGVGAARYRAAVVL